MRPAEEAEHFPLASQAREDYNTSIEVIDLTEWLALCDREGRPLGRGLLRGEMPPPGTYWRVSDAWFVDCAGRLLLQRRALGKKAHPGLWACTGGGVLHGESPEEGCVRECQEELGVTPDFRRGGLVMGYVGEHSYHDVYLFHQSIPDSALRLQPEEVMDARWFTPEEARELTRTGAFVPLGYVEQLLLMLPVLSAGKDDEYAESL